MQMRTRWYLLGIFAAAVGAGVATIGTPTNPVASMQATVPLPADSTLSITYVANEGVLISSGDKQVLIDGLHREYKPAYAFLPDSQRTMIETASAPFDDIDLILVSHLHLDHFHPEAVGRHLEHNSGATLVTSQQVVDEVEKGFSTIASVRARVISATPPLGQRVRMQVSGIEFDVLGLGHVNEQFDWIQNLGHIIHLGGRKLLHVGDAAATAETFAAFDLEEEGIDVAFLPAWFLMDEEGVALVREHINPRHVVAVHVSPGNAARTVDTIRQFFPDADAFTLMLEMRQF